MKKTEKQNSWKKHSLAQGANMDYQMIIIKWKLSKERRKKKKRKKEKS